MRNHIPLRSCIPSCIVKLMLAMVFLASNSLVRAQTDKGTIEGRVIDPATGGTLENARLTVEGTALETLSGAEGNYRLTDVPAGRVKVTVFSTGFQTQGGQVEVIAGRVVQHDIQMSGFRTTGSAGKDKEAVILDEFVVAASREMSGTALAINEQRFAPNIKNVLATDEFGEIAEGNVAEFLKFMPGVTIDYQGGNARNVSINGVPSDYVPVTVDGFGLASVVAAGLDRSVALDLVSINNAARIEVSFSPTPESPGSALAGSVNMVPRSSFERVRPAFNGSTYITMRDNRRHFHESPGPRNEYTRKVYPGFDFSYLVPVNKRFGFTISAGGSTNYIEQDLSRNSWRGAGFATNGTTFPNTTPDRPYLSTYEFQDAPKVQTRNAVGVTVDYKFSPNDRLSLSFQTSSFHSYFINRVAAFNVNGVLPGDFTPTSTRGAAGAGDIQLSNSARDRFNRTYMPTLVWRHDGPVWKSEAGIGLSHAANYDRDIDKGFFATMTVRRTGVTVGFDDIFYLRPRVITVTDGETGTPVDPFNLGNYAVTSATANQIDASDLVRSAYTNLRREFHGRVPFALKAGLDVRDAVRDLRSGLRTYTFVGRDGRVSTTPVSGDDQALPFLDPINSKRIAPLGFPRVQWMSNYLLWDYAKANPGSFTTDANADYRNAVTASKRAEEVISAAYVRGDLQLLDRRLKLMGGLRAEQTNIDAEGPLTDPTRNFQRDASSSFVLGSNGRPLPIATDALAVSRLTFVDRGARVEKEYLRLFPSLNASFNVRENLIARMAYYQSVGRPIFSQYAGAVSLPDTELPPAQNNRIAVNNVGIKAWSAQTVSARVEYYFEGVGQVSVGAFRRDFENFFGNTVLAATPEFLALYGLDAVTYGAFDVSTQYNLPGTVRMTGVDFNYKQALTFLPSWARGVQVFANASSQRATGDATANFAGFIPRSANWGVSLARERYNLRVNWNYRGRQRQGAVAAGASIEPGTYNWGASQLYVDVSAEYSVHRHFAVFANLRNLNNTYTDVERAGPSTPPQAQLRSRLDYGALWTFGVKGRF